MDEVVADIARDYLRKLAAQGKRADGRGPDDFRPIRITPRFITSADGSAKVSIGDTTVVAGIKVEQGTPFPDTPDKGVLTTNAELLPMASPTFESGPPSPQSIELARVVDRGIRESQMIDLTKLCVTPKEKVWIVYIDMDVIDYDGNLFDTASLAAVTALRNTVVPAKKFGVGEDYPLPLQHIPVSCTSVKIGSQLFFDPGLDEDRVAETRLTVATDEAGNIRAMQKGLSGTLTYDEIASAVSRASRIGASIRSQHHV